MTGFQRKQSDMWQDELDSIIDSRFGEMVEMRRHLHKNPEVSGEEFQTSLLLFRQLDKSGFHVQWGFEGRGLIADLDPPTSGDAKDLFAIRADIDALRIQDEKDVPYRSCKKGVMHACGHDAHTTIGLAAVSAIGELHRKGKLSFQPRLRGIFQPAEEICEGAAQMIQQGALRGVAAIIATHMDPSRRVGRIGIRPGVLTANCDHMLIEIHGRGGHAARPHEARDPISAAAQLIQWLYLQIPRVTDSQDAVVCTIGQIEGGHTANVIPETVHLQGTLRTLDHSVRERTMKHIERLANSVAEGTGTKISVEYGVGANAVENDPQLVDLITSAADRVLGDDSVEEIERPSMGSEDFAFYCKHVPAAMFRLGCTSDKIGGSPLHTPTFDIDEESLKIGAKIIAHSALTWMEKSAKTATDKTT
ncbi:MAG: amidohydrolase [Planctomycetota bacterium]